jgi:hypothetical protein
MDPTTDFGDIITDAETDAYKFAYPVMVTKWFEENFLSQ